MTEITVLVLVLLSVAILVVPRDYIVAVMIVGACFIPADQRIVVGGLDFTVLRILLLLSVVRLLGGGELAQVQWNSFDHLVLAWAVCGAAVYSFQWMSLAAIVNRSGVLVDLLGMYWLFRQTVRSWADIRTAARVFALCAIALVPLVGMEWMTGENPFTIVGHVTTLVRSQHYRCTAAFPHSIMLGVFWAAISPLFIAFVMMGRDKVLFSIAIAAVAFIVAATASSTPIVTLGIAIGAIIMYKWRRFAPTAAIIALGVLVALHFAMKAPVWHLLARINIAPGSTGWYRFYLLDRAISHFPDWALMGTRNTESWGMGLGDLTNQYVLEGVRGGLVTLVLFFAVLLAGAHKLLSASLLEQHRQRLLIICSVLAMLFTHAAAFGGVSYFGQINMEWCMMLAFIGAIAEWRSLLSRPQIERFAKELATA